ncbi:MAG: sulfotransferase family 2 domain-containing protein [Rhizomicrobium sp.]
MIITAAAIAGFAFLPDAKPINRALFGAWYEEDIYDQFCTAVPLAMRVFRWRIPPAMRARNLIFVHVPRVAGTSITRALYGEGCIHHHSMRYYRAIDPGFAQSAGSFAVLRDPLERFASAYAFVRAGGTALSRLSDVFRRRTAAIASVDGYLDFLEGRAALDLDFVMRPQSWFVCDPQTAAPLVKDLFVLGEDSAALAAYLAPQKIGKLPWINRAPRAPLLFNAGQRRRVELLYAADFALIESVRRAKRARDLLRGAAIAAE